MFGKLRKTSHQLQDSWTKTFGQRLLVKMSIRRSKLLLLTPSLDSKTLDYEVNFQIWSVSTSSLPPCKADLLLNHFVISNVSFLLIWKLYLSARLLHSALANSNSKNFLSLTQLPSVSLPRRLSCSLQTVKLISTRQPNLSHVHWQIKNGKS